MASLITDLSPLIARVWPQLAALAARLSVKAARAAASRDKALRLRTFRLLRPAEALARRIIARLAEEIDPGKARPAPKPGRVSASIQSQATSPAHGSGRGFCLFEPVPTFAACFGPARGGVRFRRAPRILTLDAPFPGSPAPRPAPDQIDSLAVRVNALCAALEAPERHARRLARRKAKALADPARETRLSPLRPGWPPGLKSLATPDWLRAALLDLNFELRSRPPPGAKETIRRTTA